MPLLSMSLLPSAKLVHLTFHLLAHIFAAALNFSMLVDPPICHVHPGLDPAVSLAFLLIAGALLLPYIQ